MAPLRSVREPVETFKSCCVLACCALVGLVSPLAASAQARIECSSEDSTEAEARALFRQGVEATNDERWSDAVRSLRHAYELSCHPPALLNLGVSLRALGRHRESRDVLSQLLSDHPDLPAEVSSLARRFLVEERARVAVIEIVEVSPNQTPEISFDGRAVAADEARPIRIETDAGNHSLEVRIGGHETFTWTGELTDGQVERLVVRLDPMSTQFAGSSFEWGWLTFGAGAAAVVAGVIMDAVAFAQSQDQLAQCPTQVGCSEDLMPEVEGTRTLANVGDALWIGGAVVAAAGLVLVFTLGDGSEEDAEVALVGVPGGQVLSLRGAFP